MPANDIAYLILVQSENVRNSERESWNNLRDILSDIRQTGTDAMAEMTADVSNACMDMEDFLR